MDRKAIFSKAKRIVLKVGTLALTQNLTISQKKVRNIAKQIMHLRNDGREVILVTSGSIGAGIKAIGLKERPRDMNMLQACAAVGQNELMRAYARAFQKYGVNVGQILLTKEDFRYRKRYLNIRNAIKALIRSKIVPIVNENDTVSVEEIRFGDNDTLSAQVASNLEADLLILMSSMDGLFDQDPHRTEKASCIRTVDSISADMRNLRGKSRAGGVGGIQSKIDAGRIMMKCGIPMAIVDYSMKDVIKRLMNGESVGTLFMPKKRIENKMQWMLFSCTRKGGVIVDEGAVKALRTGKASLLPSGVLGVEGSFLRGDPVDIRGPDGKDIARGISNLSIEDIEKVKGLQTSDAHRVLGQGSKKVVVHSENLVVLRI